MSAPAMAAKDLLEAHLRECRVCCEAMAVVDLGHFCVGKMCSDGQTVLEAAIRLQQGSNAGHTAETIARFESHVDRSGGPLACHPWKLTPDKDGYGDFWVAGVKTRAHRFALELHLGRRLEAHEVARHGNACVTTACCNGRHLKAGSVEDNVRDRDEAGHTAVGEKNGKAKLTADAVVVIRARAARGETPAAIAPDFGVSSICVYRVVSGKTWRHVGAPAAPVLRVVP